jgi:hypothetical protein
LGSYESKFKASLKVQNNNENMPLPGEWAVLGGGFQNCMIFLPAMLCGWSGGGAPSSHGLERMQGWAFIPLCVSTLQVLQYSIQIFPKTSAFVMVPTKRQDFTFFRNQFLPVMNPNSTLHFFFRYSLE